MSNTLEMNWTNQSAESYNLVVTKVKHGDSPTASPETLAASTASQPSGSTVSAEQSNNLSPGPEGEYQWQSTDLSVWVECQYHFPAGSSGQLVQVTLIPKSNGTRGSNTLEVSFDGENWSSGKLPTSWTSTGTTESCNCYVRDASN